MFLVDGSYTAFRAHFAQPPRHTSQGFPTHVIYGFLLMFQKMLKTWQPDYVVVSFDTSNNFRNDIYPDYKGHRPEMPEDLAKQWPLLPSLVEGFGYTVMTMDGYEADDVLGTLAKRFASPELEVYLVTADKDFTQLVDDDIQILDEMKGKVLDYDAVIEKMGVPPEQVIDALALAGDTSDNVPGVTKIGLKTAAKFLKAHGDLEGILAAAAEGTIRGKTGQRLVDEADNARLSKRLVTIDTNVPIEGDLDAFRPRGLQVDALRELFDQWEFGKVARSLLGVQQGLELGKMRVVDSAFEALDVVSSLKRGDLTSFAVGTDDAGAITGVAFGAPGAEGVWVSFEAPDTARIILDALEDPAIAKIGHGTKQWMRSLGEGRRLHGVVGDTRLVDYVLASHRRQHDLAGMSSTFLYHTLGKAQGGDHLGDGRVAAEEAAVVASLHDKLSPRMSDGQRHVYRELELPLVPVLATMERAGIRLDTDAIDTVAAELKERIEAVEKECHELAGKVFRVRSRHELRDVLFEDLGLTPGKKVKDGYSTASDVLEKLVDEHPLPAKILEYRELDKLLSTYLRKLPSYVADDGRIHTTFNQAVAATGRLSSNEPNLQNIPIRTHEGRRIRECFVPEPGHVFLSADYSQVELRVLAHFTKDAILIDGFRAGEDIHRRTAIEVFGADPDDVSVGQRSAAKAINFGLLYGMSAFRLARDLSISRTEAQQYMDDYFARMPAVKDWIEQTKEACRKDGWVETMFGRRRLIPEIHSASYSDRMAGEREAVNTVIQGTAADIIKVAMLRVDAMLASSDLNGRLLLQVHDELLLEVPEDEVEATIAAVEAEMRAAAELEVPLVVNSNIGTNWNEAHG
jgi:DNA polymerase-1